MNGVKTGDKSQIAWGAGLMILDIASFGEGTTGIKALDIGLDGLLHGAGKFTLSQIDNYVVLATKQNAKLKVMLGKFEGVGNPLSYTERAGSEYCFFDLGDAWESVSASVGGSVDEIWKINKKFIDNRKALGNEFYLSHNPVDPNYYKGYYKMEIDYLTTPVSQGGLGGTIVDIGNNLWKVIW